MGSFVLAVPEQTILGEIADRRMNQKDVAKTYALILRDSPNSVDWAKINEAIMNRWSFAGLERIKRMAWSGACWA